MNNDCMFEVLLFLDTNNIVKNISSCKSIKSTNTEYLWKLLCNRDYDKLCNMIEIDFNEGKLVKFSESSKYIKYMEKYKFCIGLLKIKKYFDYRKTLCDLYKTKKIECCLKRLTISNDIIKELHKLNQLKKIDLSYCDIKYLPDTFYNLTNLKYLDLSGNKLTTISPNIGNLTKLKGLRLNDNRLDQLPESLFNLRNLRYVGLAPTEFPFIENKYKTITHRDSFYIYMIPIN